MRPQAIFGISILLSFVVWTIVVRRYVWPSLRHRPRDEALRPLLLLHAFRFIGLAFLIPGVVSPDLPVAFARSAAYGDLLTSLLALFAYAAIRTPLGTACVWAFNLFGTTDLLRAYYEGGRTGLGLKPGLQGALYFVPTLAVPLLLITHAVVFRLLLHKEGAHDRGRRDVSAISNDRVSPTSVARSVSSRAGDSGGTAGGGRYRPELLGRRLNPFRRSWDGPPTAPSLFLPCRRYRAEDLSYRPVLEHDGRVRTWSSSSKTRSRW